MHLPFIERRRKVAQDVNCFQGVEGGKNSHADNQPLLSYPEQYYYKEQRQLKGYLIAWCSALLCKEREEPNNGHQGEQG